MKYLTKSSLCSINHQNGAITRRFGPFPSHCSSYKSSKCIFKKQQHSAHSRQLLIAKNIVTWNCVLETNNKCHITIFGFYYILHRHQFNTFNTPVRRSQVSLQDVWTEAWWFLVCPAGGLTASLWLCWAVQTGVDAADLPRHIVLMAERACCCVSSDSVAAKQPQLKTTK